MKTKFKLFLLKAKNKTIDILIITKDIFTKAFTKILSLTIVESLKTIANRILKRVK